MAMRTTIFVAPLTLSTFGTHPWKFGNKYVNGAIGGWTLSQNFFARSGLPLTVLDGAASANFIGCQRGLLRASGGWHPWTGRAARTYLQTCFNPKASPPGLPDRGVYSNQMRNDFPRTRFFDSDFSINKNFKLTERVAFGVGANFYNVFNHPNFAQPVNVLGSGIFGTIVRPAPPTGPFGSFFASLPRPASSSSRASWCSRQPHPVSMRRLLSGSRLFFGRNLSVSRANVIL